MAGRCWRALMPCIVAALLLSGCGSPLPQVVQGASASGQRQEIQPLPSVTPMPGVIRLPTAALPGDPVPTPEPLSATLVPAPTPFPPGPVGAAGAAMDRYLSSLVDARQFQGAVLVARKGTVLLSKGYGPADAAAGVPNSPQTRFRIASLTKQFTAMAVMKLQALGKLNVNDGVCAYIENCPPAWKPITIRTLLTHTSGLPNFTDYPGYEATQAQTTTPEELVGRFRDDPLLFPPGSTYMYENSDYVLLGYLIERVAGMPYDQFVQNAIFGPLQMTSSGFDHSKGQLQVTAKGYQGFGEPAPFLDATTLFSAGGLYSSVEDMYRWSLGLDSEQFAPAPLRNAVFTPFLNNYGYGWKITQNGGRRAQWHPGNMDGVASYILRLPDEGITVVVLSNMAWADAQGIGNYLGDIALDAQ